MASVPLSDLSRRLVSSSYTSLLDLRAPCPSTAHRRAELLQWLSTTAHQLDALLRVASVSQAGSTVHAASRSLDGALGSLHECEEAWRSRLYSVGLVQHTAAEGSGGGQHAVARSLGILASGAYTGLPLAISPDWAVVHGMMADATRTQAALVVHGTEEPHFPATAALHSSEEAAATLTRRVARRALLEALSELGVPAAAEHAAGAPAPFLRLEASGVLAMGVPGMYSCR